MELKVQKKLHYHKYALDPDLLREAYTLMEQDSSIGYIEKLLNRGLQLAMSEHKSKRLSGYMTPHRAK